MSALAIMRTLLVAHTPLTTLVPPERIFCGVVPQNTVLPAVSITEVSGNQIPTIARRGPTITVRARVQVTVIALTLSAQKAAIRAAGLGAGVHRGVYSGFNTLSVMPDGIGPDLNNLDDDGIYEQSRDFVVTFVEPQ